MSNFGFARFIFRYSWRLGCSASGIMRNGSELHSLHSFHESFIVEFNRWSLPATNQPSSSAIIEWTDGRGSRATGGRPYLGFL